MQTNERILNMYYKEMINKQSKNAKSMNGAYKKEVIFSSVTWYIHVQPELQTQTTRKWKKRAISGGK